MPANIILTHNQPNLITQISSTPIRKNKTYNKRLTISNKRKMSPQSPIFRPSRAAVGKISQRASFSSRRSRPVLSNADSGATGNYLALADISVLRNVTLSSPLEQISVEVATGTLTRSIHHGYLDVPGTGP